MQCKIILIGILLVCVSPVMAWDEESGYAEGEYVTVEFVGGNEYTDSDDKYNPHWIDKTLLWIHKIFCFFTSNTFDTPANQVVVNYTIERETWNPITETYEPDDNDDYTWTEEKDVPIPANVSTEQTYTEDPIHEMVKHISDDQDLIDDITTTDDDPEHPDIFNTTVKISGGGVDIEESGYVAITEDYLDDVVDEINKPDYGFALDGRGSDGGGGGIYEGINIYSGEGDSNARAMGDGFGMVFFFGIPLLFILCVMRFLSKMF